MERGGGRVHVGDEVPKAIVRILDEAEQYIVVVTPWMSLWPDVDRAVERARTRGVKDIHFIVRSGLRWSDDQKDDRWWLEGQGARVSWIPDLHAKIYMNEKAVVLASMNLTESSIGNLEIACTMTAPAEHDKVWHYVDKNIARLTPNRGGPIAAEPTRKGPVQAGFCISCRADIVLDRMFPLCADHSALWQDRFRGNYCLMCGEGAKTSLYKPLCDSCYDHNVA